MALWTLVKQTWSDFSDDDCGTLAAALAYYTVFSLPAILLIVLVIAGAIFGRDAVAGQIQGRIGETVGPRVAAMIQQMLRSVSQSTSGGTWATVFGIAGILYAATNVLTQLQTALNRAWEVRVSGSSLKRIVLKRFTSLLLIIGVVILVLISLGAATAMGFAGSMGISLPSWLLYVVEIGVSWFIFVLVFGILFRTLPDARIDWQDVKVGAIVTASLFILGKFLISLYLAHSSATSAYGAAGALALLLLWAYYSAMIFLFGAELTQVWARLHGSAIVPEEGAMRVTKRSVPPGKAA